MLNYVKEYQRFQPKSKSAAKIPSEGPIEVSWTDAPDQQRAELAEIKDEDWFKDTFIITKDGIVCRPCFRAKTAIAKSGIDKNQPFILCASTARRVKVACRKHINGGMSEKEKMAAKRAHQLGRGAQPRKSNHELRVQWCKSQDSVALGIQKQLCDQETAIFKRIRAVYFLAAESIALSKYKSLLLLMSDIGAFHDCPAGSVAGSMFSDYANYTSNQICREFLLCLGLAVREFWSKITVESNRISIATDETSDAAKHSQHCICYKLILSNGSTVVIFAGMHVMPRGTAKVLVESILHQLKRDGINVDKQLSMAVFDTCSTMHGCSSGVATRLRALFRRLITGKCVNHTGALAIKHAVDSIPYLEKQWYPTLIHAGNLMDGSPKKHVLLSETNVRENTETKAIGRVAATRWHSLHKAITAIRKSRDMATIIKTFRRAGEGGDDEIDEFLDAGRADASAIGVAHIFSTREFLAFVCATADVVPDLNTASKQLQAHDLDAESCRSIQDSVISRLQEIVDNPASAKRSSKWREHVAGVEACGIDVRQTRRRDDAWIDEQIKKFHICNLQQHKEMWPDREITSALTHLFDANHISLPQRPWSNAALSAHFDTALKTVTDFYSIEPDNLENDQHALNRDQLQAEWESFQREYLNAALDNKNDLLKVANAAEKIRIRKLNELEQLDGVPNDELTKFEPATNVPLKTLIGWSYQHQMDAFPCIKFLAASWLVTMESQAPVESAFSRLKRVVTPLRSCLDQKTIEILMMLILNGPDSLAGKKAGLTIEMLVTRAKEIWCAIKARRVDRVTRVNVPQSTLSYRFGVGFDHCGEAYDAVMKAAEAEEAANKAKRVKVKAVHDATVTTLPTEESPESPIEMPTGTTDEKPGHCWLLALGRGARQEKRAYLAEQRDAVPQTSDKIAVTGFGGSVWYSGEIVSIGVGEKRRDRGKPIYTIFFPADMTYVTTPLQDNCYGPGKWDNVKKKCTLGWVFLLPIEEAGEALGVNSAGNTKDLPVSASAADASAALEVE